MKLLQKNSLWLSAEEYFLPVSKQWPKLELMQVKIEEEKKLKNVNKKKVEKKLEKSWERVKKKLRKSW